MDLESLEYITGLSYERLFLCFLSFFFFPFLSSTAGCTFVGPRAFFLFVFPSGTAGF